MNLKIKMGTLNVIFLGSLALMSCSMKDNLDDMHTKTDKMADTTEAMAGKTDRIEQTTEFTFYGLRSPATHAERMNNLERLFKNPDMGTKLELATAYFYALEFQSWKDDGPDDAESLDVLKDQALEEFFEATQKVYTPNDWPWQDLTPLNPHTLDFYALSATMHKIYGQQIIWARHKGFVAPSFYSIVLDAFREFKNNPNRDPATMPRWMRMVQNFNDHALDMLKARVNYPAIEIFAECTNLNAMGSIGALYEIYWKDRKVWDLDLSDLKPSAIYRINEYLSYALQTRKALNDLGIDAEMTDDLKIPNLKSIPIRTIFSHINLVQQKDASNVAAQQVKIQISKFIYLKNLLLAPTQSFSRADGKTFDPPSQE